MIRGIIVGWEKLRVVYNVLLLVPGVVLAIVYYEKSGLLGIVIVEAVMFGVAANLCYCLGPYVELVLSALGYPATGRRIRPVLFGMGVLSSLFLMMCWNLAFGIL